jgi:hypothetical protein
MLVLIVILTKLVLVTTDGSEFCAMLVLVVLV